MGTTSENRKVTPSTLEAYIVRISGTKPYKEGRIVTFVTFPNICTMYETLVAREKNISQGCFECSMELPKVM